MGLVHLTEDDYPTGSNLNASTAPGVNDDVDLGYNIGSIWIDTTADKAYICLDNTDGAAVWKETTQSGGGATNLGYTPSATDGTVTSDTGTDATLPLATPTTGSNEAGLLAPADKSKLDDTSGTNTGDQSSIVGITGTKAQFDTAVTDGDIVYVGDTVSADDVDDAATTNKFVTAGDLTNLGNLSGTNTGDEVQATESILGIAEIATQTETDTGTDDTRIVTPKKLKDWVGPAGIGGVLSTTVSIDATATGDTTAYTVGTGEQAVVRFIIVRLTAISGSGSVPKISVGTNATAYNDILSSTSVMALTTVNQAYTFVIEGTFQVAQETDDIIIKVNNAASYTTYDIDVDLIGYTV